MLVYGLRGFWRGTTSRHLWWRERACGSLTQATARRRYRRTGVRDVTTRVDNTPGVLLTRKDSTEYDEAGNIVFTTTVTSSSSAGVLTYEDRANYYGPDNRLRVTDHRTAIWGGLPLPLDIALTKDYEEHRYDALGRRILTRTHRDCEFHDDDHPECGVSLIRRTVWDGAQEIFEIQQPFFDWSTPAEVENDTAFAPIVPLYSPYCGFH